MKILFVCHGNISRSFLAEALLLDHVRTLGLEHVQVRSAGLSAYPGNPPDERMVAYLEGLDIQPKSGGARQLSFDDLEWADRIFVMEKSHARHIVKSYPPAGEKMELLGACIPGSVGREEIIDPYGASIYHYRLVQSQISRAVDHLAGNLSSNDTSEPC